MRKTILGVAFAVAGLTALAGGASAQGWGYAPGYQPHPVYGQFGPRSWEEERWQRRMEWREQRREFWRQQREIEARRAYEAGKRDAWREQGWGARW